MTANYLPIFKAKPGEIQAVSFAKTKHANKMLPLFEISRIGETDRKAARFKNTSALTCAYLSEVAENIAKVRGGQAALVDAFQWAPDAVTETGEHILPYIYSKLQSLDVSVIPVIGYDRWESTPYRLAMQEIEISGDAYYCLRLDSQAIEDSEDPEFFLEQVHDILDNLGLEPERCAVLIDFGDVTATSLERLVNQANGVIGLLKAMKFRFFSTSGCSLPATIDGAVKKQDSSGMVLRKEMLLWQTLKTEHSELKLLFGDYGVRGPNTAESIISPHTNGKIRHTISQKYYVVRGHSMQVGNKGAQMYQLAKSVVDSPYFMGEDFSWGDGRIVACSQGEFKGSSKDWIAIDTSHHIAWIVSEVEEFEIKVAASISLAL